MSAPELAHSAQGEAGRVSRSDRIALGSQRVHTVGLAAAEQLFPAFDLGEDEQDLRGSAVLPTSRIEPNKSLTCLFANEHHVVIRSHDDLVRLLRVFDYLAIGASSRGGVVTFVTDVRCKEPEHPQRLRDFRTQLFVPKEPGTRAWIMRGCHAARPRPSASAASKLAA
ncbi:MAG: hypothetical protein SGJ13_18405, partial [Actinomycetota bacterium]|nr:hypothetical protein [Actinomycetota bacterium]